MKNFLLIVVVDRISFLMIFLSFLIGVFKFWSNKWVFIYVEVYVIKFYKGFMKKNFEFESFNF